MGSFFFPPDYRPGAEFRRLIEDPDKVKIPLEREKTDRILAAVRAAFSA